MCCASVLQLYAGEERQSALPRLGLCSGDGRLPTSAVLPPFLPRVQVTVWMGLRDGDGVKLSSCFGTLEHTQAGNCLHLAALSLIAVLLVMWLVGLWVCWVQNEETIPLTYKSRQGQGC